MEFYDVDGHSAGCLQQTEDASHIEDETDGLCTW